MNCEDLRSRLDSYLDGAADQADSEAIVIHLSTCAACSSLAQQLKTENELLNEAMQSELVAGLDLRALEGRILDKVLPTPSRLRLPLGEAALVLVGTLCGLGVLLLARFEGENVREAISRSLDPGGGPAVAASCLCAALLAVLLGTMGTQSWMFGSSKERHSERGDR